MKKYFATLSLNGKEVDYMIVENNKMEDAALYVEERFSNAYPYLVNKEGSHIHIEEANQ